MGSFERGVQPRQGSRAGSTPVTSEDRITSQRREDRENAAERGTPALKRERS